MLSRTEVKARKMDEMKLTGVEKPCLFLSGEGILKLKNGMA